MSFDEIYLVSSKKEAVTRDQLDSLQQTLNVRFPKDFSAFLEKFGSGEFSGCLNFFGPDALINGQLLYRKMYSGTFFWDKKNSNLSHQEILESVWLARSIDGDEVVLHPSKSPGFFLLPRQSDKIRALGASCSDVLNLFASGEMYHSSRIKWFCTFKDRCRLSLTTDQDFNHEEIYDRLNSAFGVTQKELSESDELSIFFSAKIGGYSQVYSNNLDIHHDLDFDDLVITTVERELSDLRLEIVEHYRCDHSKR